MAEQEKVDGQDEKVYQRWGVNTRSQHILLLITFVIQIVTGFPLSFPDTWWAQLAVRWMGGWEMRTQLHHISGLIMVLLGVYHLFWIIITSKGIKGIYKHKMFLQKKDINEIFQHMKSIFGLADEPKWDRYMWKEKVEYWGVVWGIMVMGITGFILWFPFQALEIIPYGWINLAGIVHFFEAFVATLVVLISHFYNVHFNPHDPNQKTWLHGKMTRKQMKHHHPGELEYLDSLEAKDKN